LRLPGGDCAVLLEPDLYLGIVGGSRAGDHQFGVAFVEHLYRFSGLLRKPGGGDVPLIGSELAAKSSADVILLNTNVGRWDLERPGYLSDGSGDRLS